nr:response regulator [Psychrobacter sp. PraFG1]UNK05205.1 response regulator [Psychrobacter sp. PraFG1]
MRYLTQLLSGETVDVKVFDTQDSLPVLLIKHHAGQSFALHVDEIIGSRSEVVVKPLGRPLSSIAGLSAATITAEGSVMLILDVQALIRKASLPISAQSRLSGSTQPERVIQNPAPATKSLKPQILIVDDSVTVRKVTARMLQRQGYQAHVARDGVEAVEMLQTLRPDLMLLDIEMPRMDGFEVATHVRHNQAISHLPIIMITSRSGDKHRQRALKIGVNAYLGKPFQKRNWWRLFKISSANLSVMTKQRGWIISSYQQCSSPNTPSSRQASCHTLS